MDTQDTHTGACTHCNCHNPMWKILEDDLFHPELLSKIALGLKHTEEPLGESLVISGAL